MLGTKSYIKDTILFTIMAGMNVNHVIWGILLPYYYSYLKHYNETITIKGVFGATLTLFLGLSSASFVITKLLYVFGLRKAFIFGAFVYIINNMCMYTFCNIVAVYISAFLIGIMFRYIQILTILYFNEMHSDIASWCYGVAGTGGIIASFIWSFSCSRLINPNNESMHSISYINGYPEPFFDQIISNRFKEFINIQSIVAFMVVLVPCLLIQEPKKYPSHFKNVFDYLRNRDIDIINELNETEKLVNQSLVQGEKQILERSVIGFDDISKVEISKNESLINKHMTAIEMTDKIVDISETDNKTFSTEIRTLKFWLLFLSAISRFTTPIYFISNFKTLGFMVIDNDQLLTNIFSLGAITALTGVLSASYIVEKLGMFRALKINMIILFIMDILNATIVRNFPPLFVLCLFVMRAGTGFGWQLNNILIFSVYGSELGVSLSRVFDLNGVVAMGIIVIFNKVLLEEDSFSKVFIAFGLFDGFVLLLVLFKLKKLMNVNS